MMGSGKSELDRFPTKLNQKKGNNLPMSKYEHPDCLKYQLGIVKRFGDNVKQEPYGFISCALDTDNYKTGGYLKSSNADYFFHGSECVNKAKPSAGDYVSFTCVKSKDGRIKATDVYIFSKGNFVEKDILFIQLLSEYLQNTPILIAEKIAERIFGQLLARMEHNNCNLTIDYIDVFERYNPTIAKHMACVRWFIDKSNVLQHNYAQLIDLLLNDRSKTFRAKDAFQLLKFFDPFCNKNRFELTLKNVNELKTYMTPSDLLLKLSFFLEDANGVDSLPTLYDDVSHAEEYQQRCCIKIMMIKDRYDIFRSSVREFVHWNPTIQIELNIANWIAHRLVLPWNSEVIEKLLELRTQHVTKELNFDTLPMPKNAQQKELYSLISLVLWHNPNIDVALVKKFLSALLYVSSLEGILDLNLLSVKLWIYDYTDLISDKHIFENFKPSVLQYKEQRLFLKRLFWDCCNRPNKTVLTSFTCYDWTDLSTRFVLNMLQLIYQGKAYANLDKFENSVSKFLTRNIVDSNEVPMISDYFDLCAGYMGEYKRFERPRNINFCEGRKYEKSDNNPHNKVHWWCGNKKCYRPSIELKPLNNWQEFTLWDFVNILGLEFNMDQYQKLNGYINRLLTFMDHLKCYTCGSILYPVNQSSFAFYRVTRFICSNKLCLSKDIIVYLSHCWNGACNNVIDSRKVAQCPNKWHICEFCLACCSTEKIELRNKNLQDHGQSVNDCCIGHNDSNEVYCPKCGKKLICAEDIWTEYLKKLKSLLVKQGIRRDGVKWFLFKFSSKGSIDENFAKRMNRMGIQLNPDKSRNTLLLSLENINILLCEECDFSVDVSALKNNHEYDRLFAFEKAHPELYKRLDSSQSSFKTCSSTNEGVVLDSF